MTLKDLNELISNLKANGLTDNQMQITFLLMYRNDKITYSDLKLLLAKINYSIEEEIVKYEFDGYGLAYWFESEWIGGKDE